MQKEPQKKEKDDQSFVQYPTYGTSSSATSLLLSLQDSSVIWFSFFIKDPN